MSISSLSGSTNVAAQTDTAATGDPCSPSRGRSTLSIPRDRRNRRQVSPVLIPQSAQESSLLRRRAPPECHDSHPTGGLIWRG